MVVGPAKCDSEIFVSAALTNNRDYLLAHAGYASLDHVRHATLRAKVEPRRMRMLLPEHIACALGLKASAHAGLQRTDGPRLTRPLVGDVRLALCGREGVFTAVVEPDRDSALIGAIVLEDLDLIVDCVRQTLTPRDPTQIISEA